MKHTLIVLSLLLLICGLVHAQALEYRVVFDLTSKDSMEQKSVMRWVKEIRAAHPTHNWKS